MTGTQCRSETHIGPTAKALELPSRSGTSYNPSSWAAGEYCKAGGVPPSGSLDREVVLQALAVPSASTRLTISNAVLFTMAQLPRNAFRFKGETRKRI
jgi:hypothetical protein